MTASKQEHIVSTLPPLFQFIKNKCLSKYSILRPNLPVHEFYTKYIEYCEAKGIKPLAKVVVSRTLSNELGITSTRPYINGERTRAYNITYDELCKKFFDKNWIHESDKIDGIDIPETSTSDPKALDQFLSKVYTTNELDEMQKIVETPVPKPESKSEPEGSTTSTS